MMHCYTLKINVGLPKYTWEPHSKYYCMYVTVDVMERSIRSVYSIMKHQHHMMTSLVYIL